MNRVLTETVEAYCPKCHKIVTLDAGEFWPAWCECSTVLRETGLSRHHRSQKHQQFDALLSFISQITRQDAEWLRIIGIRI